MPGVIIYLWHTVLQQSLNTLLRYDKPADVYMEYTVRPTTS